MRLNVFSEYTYTLETIIQAGQKGMAITSVPIRVNGDLRPSRLVRSSGSYVRRSIGTIARIFMTYKPMEFFIVPGAVLLRPRHARRLRFLLLLRGRARAAGTSSRSSWQPCCCCIGFQLIVFGLLAELLGVNRKLLEDIQWRLPPV